MVATILGRTRLALAINVWRFSLRSIDSAAAFSTAIAAFSSAPTVSASRQAPVVGSTGW